jgi:hypothetical protein
MLSLFLIITLRMHEQAVVASWAYSEVGEVDEQLIAAGFELHQVWVPSLDVISDSPSMPL